MRKTHFTTGEFASLFGINKQTLFFYDRIGIFSPETVAENGYRYYSYTQIETLETLLMFKELNVPLSRIKELMERRSPASLMDMLHEQQQVLSERIAQLQRAHVFIEEKTRLTEEGMTAPIGRIVLREFPCQTILLTEYKGDGNEADIARAVNQHFTMCRSLDLSPSTGVGAIIPSSSVTEDSYSYSHFYSSAGEAVIADGSYRNSTKKFGGEYLVIYDDHGYRNLHSLVRKLLKYADDNSVSTEDEIFEDLILDDLSVDGYYHYMVRLAIKIK